MPDTLLAHRLCGAACANARTHFGADGSCTGDGNGYINGRFHPHIPATHEHTHANRHPAPHGYPNPEADAGACFEWNGRTTLNRRHCARKREPGHRNTYAVGYADGVVEWRSLDGNQVLNSVPAHSGRVFGLEFVAQSEALLSSGADCRWAMWQSGTLVQSFPPYLSPSIWADTPAGPTGIRHISNFGGSGAVALSLSDFPVDFREHPNFVLFHLADGEFIEVTADFPAHFDAVVFSENGRYLALDGPLSVWKLNDDLSYSPLWISEQYVSANLAFSADAQLLVAENQLFLTESGELVATLPYAETEISSVAFSQDGRFLAVSIVNGLIHLYGIP